MKFGLASFVFIMTIGSLAFAGAGGFRSETCVSKSGRTVLTTLYSDSSKTQVNLIIDGVSAKYENETEQVKIVVGGEVLSVQRNGNPILDIFTGSTPEKATLAVSAGTDPRLNSVINSYAQKGAFKVELTCKGFTQQP